MLLVLAATRARKSEAFLAPQGAAPLRGSPQCAHWGKGSPELEKSRWEKTGRSADISFPKWQSLSHGTLSVLAALGHLSQRERQGRRLSPSPRGALPLLGEVPSAHTGERGRRSRIRAGGKRQDAVQTILFPLGSFSAMATPQSRYRSTAPPKGEPRAGTIILRPAGRCPS